ncbi:MAG: PH domain-containing protein [bacterium]|nr:PH domain-containing protein [bacterium]MDN5835284.1 PH domain-containing protein [bacterium]
MKQTKPTPRQAPELGDDYTQPAAYDTQGRPLYLHPPTPDQGLSPQPIPPAPVSARTVYTQHPVEPAPYQVSEETKARHDRSLEIFPNLDLSDNEYVIRNAARHPIGIFMIWFGEVFGMLVLGAVWLALMLNPDTAVGWLDSGEDKFNFTLVMLGLEGFLLLIGWVGSIIYNGNKFIVTNERVIQFVRTGLFARRRKTINLNGVEDVSFRQHGIIPTLFGYGSIRLSTVGDETTYRFSIVDKPDMQTKIINKAVQAAKTGRPVPESMLADFYTNDNAVVVRTA